MKMRKLTTNAVAMLLALVGCMGCGNRSASSVDNLIRVDVMADYPEKELILQDLMDVEYIALETTDDFITKGAVKAIGKDIMLVTNRGSDGDILVFDRNGKGLRKINRLGQSGEEYTQLTGLVLDEDNDEIFVKDNPARKIGVYDLLGNYKRSFKFTDTSYYNYIFNYDYNRLYDLYFMAGLKLDQMRVASPFNDYAKDSLNLYRILDPEIWSRLVGRVKGANFCAIYGKTKALGYRSLTLPEGHTWESYTKFLLDTLPERLRNNYIKKFKTSIEFWHNTGGGLEEDVIQDLIDHGYNIKRNGISNHTVMRNSRVIFVDKIPDHTDDIKSSKDIPSWKRMCYCILRNDHTCRFMGFGLTREQQKRINELKYKYSKVGEENDI